MERFAVTMTLTDADRARYVEDVAAFVRIPSRSTPEGGEEGELQAVMAARMDGLGARVRCVEAADVPGFLAHPLCHGPHRQYAGRPTVIGEIGPPEAPALLILAHSDTVRVTRPDEWTVDPFAGEVREGAIWGLGAADDKWGLAAMLAILCAVRHSGRRLQKRLIFASTIDEESGVGNGTLLLKLAGIRAEAALYLDGPALTVYIGCMGGSNLYLRPVTPLPREVLMEHAGLVQQVCEGLSRARQALYDRPHYRNNWSRERSVICYTYPDDPQRPLLLAFYTLPEEARADVCAMLEEALAAGLGAVLEDYELSYREPWFEPALISPELPLARRLAAAARHVLQREPAVGTISKQDSFVLTNHAGIPTVSWGGKMQTTGRGSPHNPDENVPIDEAWAATCAACDAVRRWLQGED